MTYLRVRNISKMSVLDMTIAKLQIIYKNQKIALI